MPQTRRRVHNFPFFQSEVEPNSLSARLLKAIYFPDTTILEAELGHHPSQIGRPVLDGRVTMRLGIVRRIGDGTTTNIWTHYWIPRVRPIRAMVDNPPQTVSELIAASSASWKEVLVHQVFTPLDAESVLKIPLCTRQVEEFWAWAGDPRGIFRCDRHISYSIESRGEEKLGWRAGKIHQTAREIGGAGRRCGNLRSHQN